MSRTRIPQPTRLLIVVLAMLAFPAYADVTWTMTATAAGHPDVTGVVTTPDPPFSIIFAPPNLLPMTGTITIAPGTAGGTGTTFDVATELTKIDAIHNGAAWTNFSLTSSPPNPDGYRFNPTGGMTFEVIGPGSTVGYTATLVEATPVPAMGPTAMVVLFLMFSGFLLWSQVRTK